MCVGGQHKTPRVDELEPNQHLLIQSLTTKALGINTPALLDRMCEPYAEELK